jgi:hypothetical protein
MNLWHWLLGGDVPTDATLRSLSLGGSGLLPLWAVPLVALPLLAGAACLYFTETVRLSPFRRAASRSSAVCSSPLPCSC